MGMSVTLDFTNRVTSILERHFAYLRSSPGWGGSGLAWSGGVGQLAQVAQVFGPPTGGFVLPQHLQTDDRDAQAAQLHQLAGGVGLRKGHAADLIQHFQPHGGHAQPNDLAGLQRLSRHAANAELMESGHNPAHIIRVQRNEHVHVTSSPHKGVQVDGIVEAWPPISRYSTEC
jgi:hypothetical protein